MAQSEHALAPNDKPDHLSSIHPWDPHCIRGKLTSLNCTPTQLFSELNMHSVTLHTLPHKQINLIKCFKESRKLNIHIFID